MHTVFFPLKAYKKVFHQACKHNVYLAALVSPPEHTQM